MKVWRYLVYLKYWTLNLRPLMVYPKVLLPLNVIIKGIYKHKGRLNAQLSILPSRSFDKCSKPRCKQAWLVT